VTVAARLRLGSLCIISAHNKRTDGPA